MLQTLTLLLIAVRAASGPHANASKIRCVCYRGLMLAREEQARHTSGEMQAAQKCPVSQYGAWATWGCLLIELVVFIGREAGSTIG